MTYAEKLKDPRWQRKRLEIFERDEWHCQCCLDGENTLVVHHLRYEKGKEPWEYPNECFKTLCESCHNNEFEVRPEYEKMLLSIIKEKGFMADDVYRIVKGFLGLNIKHAGEVTASFIEFILTDEEVIKTEWSAFWDNTKKIAAQKKGGAK